MSPFSLRIREEVLATYPAWVDFAASDTYQGSDPYLVVTVPPPSEANIELPLRISTWDDEITVDLDFYHAHFDRWSPGPDDSRHQSAQLFVQSILEEGVAAASWWQGAVCKVCAQIEPGASLEPPVKVAYTSVRVRSWKGSHNADRAA